MWHGVPAMNGCPADLVLGQRDFGLRDESGGVPALSSMRWPHGVTLWGERLSVTDAGNNRIMLWDAVPIRDNQACERLLGQRVPALVDHNQSLYWPSDATLRMPYGIAAAGDWLLAADTANSRLLAWHADDAGQGAKGRALIGQAGFATPRATTAGRCRAGTACAGRMASRCRLGWPRSRIPATTACCYVGLRRSWRRERPRHH